jgi:hypothetical protein
MDKSMWETIPPSRSEHGRGNGETSTRLLEIARGKRLQTNTSVHYPALEPG